MVTSLFAAHNNRIVMFFMVLMSLIFIATSSSAIAQEPSDPMRIRRDQMMKIADRYWTYTWTATEANRWHTNDGLHNGDKTDTPDADWCNDPWGCWEIAPAINVGIPYAWGGSTAVEDKPGDPINLYLKPQDWYRSNRDWGFFGDKLIQGAPAGDIGTTDDPAWDFVNGVDCIGFVGQVWRRASRLNMSKVNALDEYQQQIARPIQFKDLQPGDILMRYYDRQYDHVVVFKEWVNYVPGSGEPVPGETAFWAYESALGPHKVVVSEYLLRNDPDHPIQQEQRYFRGKLVPQDVVTVRRLGYCDPGPLGCTPEGAELPPSDPAYAQYLYYRPYTYINPIDVVLVIDDSPSMYYTDPPANLQRMTVAREAAKLFVDLMRPGDKIGVVKFGGSPVIVQPLLQIQTDAEKTLVKQQIDTINSEISATSIGSALLAGEQMLTTDGASDPNRFMVLLSDGGENTCPCWPGVMGSIVDPVHTLGFGLDQDSDLMRWISEHTGGIYRDASPYTPNQIMKSFNDLYLKTYGEIAVYHASGTVRAPGTAEHRVTVDSAISSMTLSLYWPDSTLDFTLLRPNGQLVDPTIAAADPDITYTAGSTYKFYTVFAPEPGEWKLQVGAPSFDEDYAVNVAADDSMTLSVRTDQGDYFTGDSIKISAFIEGSSATNPLGADNVRSATMSVAVDDPSQLRSTFDLYDDGLHEDGDAGDGVYANVFSETPIAGTYNFDVQVSGVNELYGQPFTREYEFSTLVKPAIEVQPASWQFEYPTTTQTTFQVREISGVESLDNVSFSVPDLVQDRPPFQTLASSAFAFTPNGFSVPVSSSQDVVASLAMPPGQPAGTYAGNIAVSSSGGTITLPVKVRFGQAPAISATSSGSGNNCALTSTGGVKCWGDGYWQTPIDVPGLTSGVSAVSSGAGFVCVLTTSGGVKCWGQNSEGQLGNGTTVWSDTPVDVTGLTTGVVQVSAGYDHACAVTVGGAAKCWGANGAGQLGNNSTRSSSTPVNVRGLSSGAASISAGAGHTCAVTTAGAAKCWGGNGFGQLGDGTSRGSRTPVNVSGLGSGVASISAGYYYTCALTTSGGAKCWGDQIGSGCLGDGTTTVRYAPVDVIGLTSGVASISANLSGYTTCAVTTTGAALCWGDDRYGQIGDGTIASYRLTATNVVGLYSGVTSISPGWRHVCARLSTGEVKCWGANTYGQLGDGTEIDHLTPVAVDFGP